MTQHANLFFDTIEFPVSSGWNACVSYMINDLYFFLKILFMATNIPTILWNTHLTAKVIFWINDVNYDLIIFLLTAFIFITTGSHMVAR